LQNTPALLENTLALLENTLALLENTLALFKNKWHLSFVKMALMEDIWKTNFLFHPPKYQ
jgi:hypothetical protein